MNKVVTDYRTNLSSLLRGIYSISSQFDREISDLTLDSRQAKPGSCFLSVGSSIKQTINNITDSALRGSCAILTDKDVALDSNDVPVFVLKDLGNRVGEIAERFFKYPSSDLRVCAVTGTNGKTTVSYLTALAIHFLEGKCGYIGTLGAGEVKNLEGTSHTTLDAVTMRRWLAGFKSSGASSANVEASSHGIAQGRLQALKFHSIAFTNLGHDHLDYHGTVENYRASKVRLFDENFHKHTILNADDPHSIGVHKKLMRDENLWVCSRKQTSFSENFSNLITAKNIQTTSSGVVFDLSWNGKTIEVASPLLGVFNIDNLLMVTATLLSLGYELDQVGNCIQKLVAVPGRMELLGESDSGSRVYLDYAHTPDSLSAILCTVKTLNPNQIFLVFGCGGDRDKTKRAPMGAIAEKLADKVFLTSDNPRYEDQVGIFSDIMADVTHKDKFEIEPDREAAIRQAILLAQENDYVVIAGKGHETTQSKNGVVSPFCDRTIATTCLQLGVN